MNLLRASTVLLVLSVLLVGCVTAESTITIPPPIVGENGFPVSLTLQKVGESEIVGASGDDFFIDYRETGGSVAGSVAHERVCMSNEAGFQVCSNMNEVTWEDWGQGQIKLAEFFGPNGEYLGAQIAMQLDDLSILQFLKRCEACPVNRSRLVYKYVSPNPGDTPVLTDVLYIEKYGINSEAPMLLGLQAQWTNAADTFPEYARWGFWENSHNATDQVVAALNTANSRLVSDKPDYLVVDTDSAREIIGRQTGLYIELNGQPTGTIDFTYNELWGRMPNTNSFGRGALRRIEWNLGAGQYYCLSVVSNALSKTPATLFVLADNSSACTQVENTEPTVSLYGPIRDQEIPGVRFAVFATGYIGNITGVDSDGDSVKVGEGGGIHYRSIGDVSHENVALLRNLLDLMGQGGVDASGFYYAHSPASGNGLHYYLSMVYLATAPEELAFKFFGYDVGVLDRVGYADLSIFNTPSPEE